MGFCSKDRSQNNRGKNDDRGELQPIAQSTSLLSDTGEKALGKTTSSGEEGGGVMTNLLSGKPFGNKGSWQGAPGFEPGTS